MAKGELLTRPGQYSEVQLSRVQRLDTIRKTDNMPKVLFSNKTNHQNQESLRTQWTRPLFLGVVAHVCNLRLRQEVCHELEASLGYRMSPYTSSGHSRLQSEALSRNQ